MALHRTPASMLKESLDESIEAARFCVDYKKIEEKWGDFKTGGCLGFPSAILLFSIIDTIGSYFYKNESFKIKVDKEFVSIKEKPWEHFLILNSKYFGQSLSMDFIQALYRGFRSKVTHNSVLGKNTRMFQDQMDPFLSISYSSKAFATTKDNDKIVYLVSIKELFKLCENAIVLFKTDIDKIVPISRQGKSFH